RLGAELRVAEDLQQLRLPLVVGGGVRVQRGERLQERQGGDGEAQVRADAAGLVLERRLSWGRRADRTFAAQEAGAGEVAGQQRDAEGADGARPRLGEAQQARGPGEAVLQLQGGLPKPLLVFVLVFVARRGRALGAGVEAALEAPLHLAGGHRRWRAGGRRGRTGRRRGGGRRGGGRCGARWRCGAGRWRLPRDVARRLIPRNATAGRRGGWGRRRGRRPGVGAAGRRQRFLGLGGQRQKAERERSK